MNDLRKYLKRYWGLDTFETTLVLIGTVIIGGFILIGVKITEVEAKAKAEFMEECMQDLKRYECEAMWRAGNRRDSTPVIIPIPR